MIYSILIHETPGLVAARTKAEQLKIVLGHRQLQDDTKESGVFIGSAQLAESGAVVLHPGRKNPMVTDGPYAETKELFVGFYLFECENLDEAIRLAKQIPLSESGHVEIRPVVWASLLPV